MQSVLQLMGEKEMYDYWSQTYRVHNLEWSQAKAADILDAWQKKFTQVTAARSGQEWLETILWLHLNSKLKFERD